MSELIIRICLNIEFEYRFGVFLYFILNKENK